jgi:hypothetical protein
MPFITTDVRNDSLSGNLKHSNHPSAAILHEKLRLCEAITSSTAFANRQQVLLDPFQTTAY